VSSRGNSTQQQRYSFTDTENNKSGVRYYRLKMIDKDGGYSYSAIRPVLFNNDIQWQVYPNPSPGFFNLVYQLQQGEVLNVKIFDGTGRVVQQHKVLANGFMQKLNIDMQKQYFPAGLYLMEAISGNRKQVFHLMKQ
jgi:hypothetical protein